MACPMKHWLVIDCYYQCVAEGSCQKTRAPNMGLEKKERNEANRGTKCCTQSRGMQFLFSVLLLTNNSRDSPGSPLGLVRVSSLLAKIDGRESCCLSLSLSFRKGCNRFSSSLVFSSQSPVTKWRLVRVDRDKPSFSFEVLLIEKGICERVDSFFPVTFDFPDSNL